MGRIVVSTNMTLDGVVEDPDGQEGSVRGGWFQTYGGEDLAAWTELETAEAMDADALLLGRASDAWFAERWTNRSTPWADRLNGMPKHVVSSTLQEARWTNATVLSGDVASEVRAVRESHEGDILVYASYRLLGSLLDHGLVDEVRLVVFPVVLGRGRRLFGELVDPTRLRLLGVGPLGEHLVLLRYSVAPG